MNIAVHVDVMGLAHESKTQEKTHCIVMCMSRFYQRRSVWVLPCAHSGRRPRALKSGSTRLPKPWMALHGREKYICLTYVLDIVIVAMLLYQSGIDHASDLLLDASHASFEATLLTL